MTSAIPLHDRGESSTGASSSSCPSSLSDLRASGKFHKRYEMLPGVVGVGAYGLVKTCRDRRTGATWAVKLMRTTTTHGGGSSQRDDMYGLPLTSKADIYAELSIMASLLNGNMCVGGSTTTAARNTIQLREFYEEPYPGGLPGEEIVYVVTEFLAGGDLLAMVEERGTLPEEDARGVFRSVLKCFVDLQSRGIVHRDVKLENIVLTTPHDFQNGVKLIDFGLATDVNLSGPPTEFCGTPLNVAPEIIEAGMDSVCKLEPGHHPKACYSFPCDMWSAGVALFTMLSGETAFQYGAHSDVAELYASILDGRYNFWDPAWHMVSDSAKDLVVSCLTVDPLKRISVQEALQHPWLQE